MRLLFGIPSKAQAGPGLYGDSEEADAAMLILVPLEHVRTWDAV